MKSIQVITERDNVATALEALEAGRQLTIGAANVTVREAIPRGHKVAVRPISSGEPVVKYGSPIGMATADIPVGAHVHIHNVSSTRGRGDLGAAAERPAAERSAAEPRLAEPPDE